VLLSGGNFHAEPVALAADALAVAIAEIISTRSLLETLPRLTAVAMSDVITASSALAPARRTLSMRPSTRTIT
jgi:histidine ammonia-lyase